MLFGLFAKRLVWSAQGNFNFWWQEISEPEFAKTKSQKVEITELPQSKTPYLVKQRQFPFVPCLFKFMFDFFDDDEMPWQMKFFVWGRKIEDEIYHKEEETSESFEGIRKYLQECADAREKYLDPFDLTEPEEYYTKKIHEIFEKYKVIDPIYDRLFGE